MWHVGIDLHRATVVLAAVNDAGEAMNPITIPCSDTLAIASTVKALGSFRAVIEACGTYRWLYDLLRPHGTVFLAHPMRLRAMIQRRTKTDKLDAQLLANLLRINQIPLAYIPPEPYQQLRDLTRCRARLGRQLAEVKIQLRALLARQNRQPPSRTPFGASRPGLVPRPRLRAGRGHGPRRAAGTVPALCETDDPLRSRAGGNVAGVSASGSAARHSRHRIVFGAVDCRRNRRAGSLPHGQASGRLYGPHVARSPIRRPLLSGFHHAAGFSLAAMGSGASGDEGRPR